MDSKNLQSLAAAYNRVGGAPREVDARNSISVRVAIEESDVFNIIENAYETVFCLNEVETKETREGTKYKVRVKDKTTGSSYVRFATREKIAELRANPNIASVELTDEHVSGGTADGASGKTQTFGAGPNANRSSSQGYQRPVAPMSQRPDMAARMAARDKKALS